MHMGGQGWDPSRNLEESLETFRMYRCTVTLKRLGICPLTTARPTGIPGEKSRDISRGIAQEDHPRLACIPPRWRKFDGPAGPPLRRKHDD
jgi:hypothetical protein